MITWPYLAGFLDGDGWITRTETNRTYARWSIGWTQSATAEQFMLEIVDFLGHEGINVHLLRRVVRSPRVPTPVAMIDIRIGTQPDVVKTSRALLPYLNLKRDLATRCLAEVSARLARRGVGLPKQPLTKLSYWSAEEDAKLVTLHADGYSNAAIAAALRRSSNGVAHRLYRQRIVRPKSVRWAAVIQSRSQSR